MKVPLLVGDLLARARALYGGVEAVVCGGRRFTYQELSDRIWAFSAALAELGIGKGDVVAYVSFNCHRLLEGYYAVPQLGAILMPVNIRLTPPDVAYILNDAEARAVVVDRALAGLIAPITGAVDTLRHTILMGGSLGGPCPLGGLDYESLISQFVAGTTAGNRSSDPLDIELDEDDVAELFYTSGTTARPKGVMLTHRNLVLHAAFTNMSLWVDDTDVQLHSIPLFHVNGWGTPHTVTAQGGRHVMLPKFDPEEVLETIEREQVTVIFMVPTMAVMLLSSPSIGKRNLASLRRVMLGGAATPPALMRALDERLPDCTILCGYGLSETTPVLTCASVKRGLSGGKAATLNYRITAGMPIPGVRVEVLDADGKALPHDGKSVGEVCARGNTIMKGYWKQPEETARAIVDGWFHTGDMGTIDAHGYVTIVDRKKDIIITGGENVASIEIEKVLCEHAAVLECAVIAAPDERWGEVPVALVVARPGMSVDEAALVAHCQGRLAGFKVPKKVNVVESLPKGGTGKILKRELREAYARNMGAPARPVPR